MAITSVWASVPTVKGSDTYGTDASYITASINKTQNDALQSRDLFLLNKFKEYYTQNEIDNLLSSYTTNLDWKESVDTYEDILTTYPSDISMYNWLDEKVLDYETLLDLYPIDYESLIWQSPVDTYDSIAVTYPSPSHNWAVVTLDTNKKYKYDAVNNVWSETIDKPTPNMGVILEDNTKYVFNEELNSWILLDAPPQDGWVVNVRDTNYTYRYDQPTDTWIAISANAIPLATENVNGLLSKEDYALIRSLGLETVFKSLGFIDDNGNITDLQGILTSSIIPKIYLRMNQMEERAFPLGAIVPYAFNTDDPPIGYVFAEGGEYSRLEYPDMWSKLEETGEYVTDPERFDFPGRFTNGDGETTFRVPDLRGVFVRGLDNGKGYDDLINDVERTFGSYENDSIKEHTHTVPVTGVGSVDDAEINDDKLILAGTTQNSYTNKSIISEYNSEFNETRPKNLALRFIVKVLPTEKIPTYVNSELPPELTTEIDADKLNGHTSSISASSGHIPVAGPNGKLDSSWFDLSEITIGEDEQGNPITINTYKVLDDYFVHQSETSTYPTSNKIPYSNDDSNLDDWLSIVTENDVDVWIDYLNNPDYDISLSSYDESKDSNKFFISKKKFIKFLVGLKEFIKTFKHVYTTEEVIPTNERGYISNAERLKYSDKYTKSETYQLLYNFLQSYIPLTDASVVSEPDKIPRADENGKIDIGWMPNVFLDKIGTDNFTGYAEVKDNEVTVKSGQVQDTLGGNVYLEGGGNYSLSDVSPAKVIVSGTDTEFEPKGGDISLFAGAGGTNPSSVGGSVIIQSGSGTAYNGTIDLNNIKVNKNNTIYTNVQPITLRQNADINQTNFLELNSDGLTYMHDNLVDDSDDYRFTINKDGTIDTNKPNVANSISILNDKALVPFENLPKTVLVNNIGDFIRDQNINTVLGNVIVGNIAQNSTITIDDNTANEESRELTFIINCKGPYNLNWPINVTWISGHEPYISYGETAVIKLFRVGNGEWIGWKVGDGSSSGSNVEEEILINDTEVPPDSFTGKLHIYIEEESEEPEEPEEPEVPQLDPSISLSGVTISGTSVNMVTSDSDEIVLTDTTIYLGGITPTPIEPSEPEEPEVTQLNPLINLSGLALNGDSSNVRTSDSDEVVLTEIIFNSGDSPITPVQPDESEVPEEPVVVEPEVGLSGLAINTDSSHLMISDSDLLKLTDTDFNR